MLTWLPLWLASTILSRLCFGWSLHDTSRPFELIAIRHPDTLECIHLALKEIQIYRGLPDGGHKNVSSTFSGHERLRYIDRNVASLWSQAESICGDTETWDFQVLLDEKIPHPFVSEDAQNVLALPGASSMIGVTAPLLELEPLITSGPSNNRVDFVFFADGYTAQEKGKFLEDAKRLATDISGNQTFNTVKPLMNFWAAFTSSNESGIGAGGSPKDTPFGLYRDGTELRGVYYSKPNVARAACFSLGDICDYPILMGNDPLYGGLGGEFTVITPSLANGALVLRHELGHSVIDVGEEYDGGYDYFGVNAAHDASVPISWAHWFTNSSQHHASAGTRVERSVMPMQAYPWTLLNMSAPWIVRFNSSGTYPRHLVRFSLSGLPDGGDLTVELDGEDLGWVPRQDIGLDRWHYDVHRDSTLSGGEHELRFTLKNADTVGVAQLCSTEILEFGDETEFVSKPGHYSVYPTFSDQNATSYRPTNEDCLMRIVTTPNFCKVCLEGLWLSLLRRVDFIDDMRSTCVWEVVDPSPVRGAGTWKRMLELDLVPVAHLREEPVAQKENYAITWTKDGAVMEAFTNKTQIEVDGDVIGTYAVDVHFDTEEVRVDVDGLLASRGEYIVARKCGV
ncbi:IgA peptidase M64-domain-containing protein [Amylocystis lapponica]|nr:IgA peptidase M64-domain-containing protein [Amylocystis lapponica]